MNRRIASMAIAALAGSALAASTASADTVVMGSTLAADDAGGVSGTAATVSAQIAFAPATSPNPVISPANGLITGWKVKSMDDGAIYTLKVLRPNGAVSLVTATNSSFLGVTSVQAPSAVPAGTGVATPAGAIFSYPAALPIQKGDYIGLLTGGATDGLPQAFTNGLAANLIANNFGAAPADGGTANLLADAQHDLLLQATVKFCKVPDLKGQKAGAAQAALAAADCAAKVTRKPTKKKKNVGKVTEQSLAPGTTAAPGTEVPIVVGKKAKTKKKKKKKKKK
jgi:hypothetical protein